MTSETYYVDELIKAEKEANKIIEAAQKERERKLKGARDAAEREIEEFRTHREAEYRKLQERTQDKEFETRLKQETDNQIQGIFADFEKHKDKVVDLLIKNVLTVDLEIPQTIREKYAKKQ